MTIHHFICLTGYGTPFLYRRFASEGMVGMFLSDISNPFLNLRLCFDCIDDNTIGNFLRFLFRNGDVDSTECKRKGNLIKAINDVIFVVTFCIGRTFGYEFLVYYIHTSQAPLHFKLLVLGLWFLSYVWLWEIINKTSDVLATKVFPGNVILDKIHKFIKKCKPYLPVYLLVCAWMTSRHMMRYHGVYAYLIGIFASK